nr:phospholipase [Streptomyces mirabilis]
MLLATGAAPALADSTAPSGTVSAQATPTVTKGQTLAKLKTLTGNSESSETNWDLALGQYRTNKQAIKKYKFNWSTDYCSASPDKIPGGYDFSLGCYRHDFGYRNYKHLVGQTAFRRDHKARIDKALLGDLNRVCGQKFWADPYTPPVRKRLKAACYKTATKYYNAVRALG